MLNFSYIEREYSIIAKITIICIALELIRKNTKKSLKLNLPS